MVTGLSKSRDKEYLNWERKELFDPTSVYNGIKYAKC